MSEMAREIHTGVNVHKVFPDTWQLYAECPDEMTSMVLMGEQWRSLFPMEEAAFAASEWPARLLAEHLERCGACAAWRKPSRRVRARLVPA